MTRIATLGLLLAASSIAIAANNVPLSEVAWPKDIVRDALGKRTTLDGVGGKRATVLVFLSTECPISNAYIPTLNDLALANRAKGVEFIGLYPDGKRDHLAVAAHAKEFGLEFRVFCDGDGKIAKSLGVNVCPSVVVFDGKSKPCYRGRIDDRYFRRGAAARPVTQHDLASAIDAVLSGKPTSTATTEAIGCPIATTKPDASGDSSITYSKHMSRLFQQHCQECHRPGGVGPFSLSTYDEAVSWAEDVRALTSSGAMPPWKPVRGVNAFHSERGLSDQEKQSIEHWVAAGCPKGDSSDEPPARVFPTDWRLGKPDLVLEPTEDFILNGDGPDDYRHFVLPTNLERDEFLSAIDVMPGNQRVVHHVILYLDETTASQRLDRLDPKPGYSTNGGSPGYIPTASLGGWAPGNIIQQLPDGIARVLPKGARVVLQIHYHRSGKPERDRTKLGLYFAKKPVRRVLNDFVIIPPSWATRFFSRQGIPANDPAYEVKGTMVMPEAVVLNVLPHMHMLGTQMKVIATLPDGAKKTIVHVKDWDFNWQETYYYKEPIHLPAGTRLDMVGIFDNTSANPRNPSRPPRFVTFGEDTNDEMAFCFFEMMPDHDARSAEELKAPNTARTMANMLLRTVGADRERLQKNAAKQQAN